jgi:TPR repeat protein
VNADDASRWDALYFASCIHIEGSSTRGKDRSKGVAMLEEGLGGPGASQATKILTAGAAESSGAGAGAGGAGAGGGYSALADCVWQLGQCQFEGIGFFGRPDIEAARSKWEMLSNSVGEPGHAASQLALGRLYDLGQGGVPVDARKAVKLYKRAGAQGLPAAFYDLGLVYASGIGSHAAGYSLEPDLERCAKYMQRAADQGDYDAIVWISNEETIF